MQELELQTALRPAVAAAAPCRNQMFPEPGRILSAVSVLIHNPAPSRFSNEDIWLLEIQNLSPGHAAPSWRSQDQA